eukprot:scaffold32150_cov64-Attheya_sp.AAC.4
MLRLLLVFVCCAALARRGCAFSFQTPPSASARSALFNRRVNYPISSKATREHSVVRFSSSPADYLSNLSGNKLDGAVGTKKLGKVKKALTKAGMVAFIAGMCLALPVTLLPPTLLQKVRIIDRQKREHLSLRAGQFTARWMMRLIPFANLQAISEQEENPEPSIWVCNHVSMLDVFMLLASDKKLRGRNKRPIKIIYWKKLEDNPITKLLFRRCGFIPVDMAANKSGESNDYDRSSFKTLLKLSKQAFAEGFDVAILPEGQLNPTPEKGLRPVFSGAYTFSKMSRRPIKMMAIYGTHHLWHADESIGMTVTGRDILVRVYPGARRFSGPAEFVETFTHVVGHFGATGEDLPSQELNEWLDGSRWERSTSAEDSSKKEQPQNAPSGAD